MSHNEFPAANMPQSEQNLGAAENLAEINRARMAQLREHMPRSMIGVYEQAATTLDPMACAARVESVGTMINGVSQSRSREYERVENNARDAVAREVDFRVGTRGDVSETTLRSRYGLGSAQILATDLLGFAGDQKIKREAERRRTRAARIEQDWSGVLEVAKTAKATAIRNEKIVWGNRASEVLSELVGDPTIDPQTKAYAIERTLGKSDVEVSKRLDGLEQLLRANGVRKMGRFMTRVGEKLSASGALTNEEYSINHELYGIITEASEARLQVHLVRSMHELGIATSLGRHVVDSLRSQIDQEMRGKDPKEIQEVIIRKTDEYVRRLLNSNGAQSQGGQTDGTQEAVRKQLSPLEREIADMRGAGMNNRKIKAHFARLAIDGGEEAAEKLQEVNAALQPRGSQEFRE